MKTKICLIVFLGLIVTLISCKKEDDESGMGIAVDQRISKLYSDEKLTYSFYYQENNLTKIYQYENEDLEPDREFNYNYNSNNQVDEILSNPLSEYAIGQQKYNLYYDTSNKLVGYDKVTSTGDWNDELWSEIRTQIQYDNSGEIQMIIDSIWNYLTGYTIIENREFDDQGNNFRTETILYKDPLESRYCTERNYDDGKSMFSTLSEGLIFKEYSNNNIIESREQASCEDEIFETRSYEITYDENNYPIEVIRYYEDIYRGKLTYEYE